MDYGFMALTRRIAELESAARGHICNCRGGEATVYHTAADLARIRNVHCPVHGERDLGLLVCLPPGGPLRPDDRALCSCPPCAAREWREGQRGPLTEGEREDEIRSWEEQLSGEAMEKFDHDQAQVKPLLRQCRRRRGRRN
jgi:hypothetical protein